MPGQGQSRQSIQSAQRQIARRQVRRKPSGPSAQQVNAATNPTPVRTKPKPAPVPSAQQRRAARANRAQIVSGERAVPKIARQQRRQAKVNAQRQAYVSQGRAVEKRANELTRINRLEHPKTGGPLVDVARALSPTGGKLAPGHVKLLHAAQYHRQQAARLAPVLSVLNQLSRGYHATAGAADELVKGHGAGAAAHGFKEGALHLKHGKSFSDVLKDAGVKNKTVRSIGGFVGDVALDPSTYVTGGTGSVALRAGEKEAAKAAEQGAAKAATREVKGLKVKVGGKEVPAVRKATAHASRPVRAVGRTVVPQGMRNAARHVVADLNPDVTPVGAERAASRTVIRATRTARAKASHGVHEGQLIGKGIKKKIGEKNYQRVADAMEAGTLRGLPVELRRHAAYINRTLKQQHEAEVAAGISQGEVKARHLVDVPKITANPEETAKALAKARRAMYRAGRGLERAKGGAHVAQGRAEVLSRNVGGRASENVATRGTSYAAGGLGVKQSSLALQNARHLLEKAKAAHASATDIHEAEKELAAAQRKAQRAAIAVNKKRAAAPKGYLPHALNPEVLAAEGKRGLGGVGRRTVKPASSRARSVENNVPLAVLRERHPGRYSENLAQMVADRIASGRTAVAKAEANKALVRTGRKWTPGAALTKHEGLFEVNGPHLKEITNETEAAKLAADGANLHILNRDLEKRVTGGAAAELKGPGIVHAYDKGQATFKRVATFTPGFHVRNIIGDMFNAYGDQAAYKMPLNMVRAGRTLKAYGRQEKALKNLTPAEVGKATLRTRRYGAVTYDKVAKMLREHGAFRSGYIARELPELEHAGMQTQAKLKGFHPTPEKAKRLALSREDLPRLTTAMQALREGATWEEAAQKVANQHFDYQHLTDFERQVMRRAMPFYTWSARNIPLQLKTLVTKPGKYAHIQALREEATKASGVSQQDRQTAHLYHQLQLAGVKLPPQWERFLSNYEQRNAGIPINWKGHRFTLSAGLPFTDIGYVPGVASAGDFADRAAQLVTPILKDPVEFAINYSFFFHDQIQNDNSPLVKAPTEVGAFPASLKKKLGVVKITDKKSDKKMWAWPGKVDYVAHTVPGLPSQALQFSRPGGRADAGTIGRVGSVAGVKVTPVDPIKNVVDLAYRRQHDIQGELAGLRQQGFSAKNPNARYRQLNSQLKIVNELIYQGKQSQGYKVLPTAGGPLKGRSGGDGFFPDSSSSGSFPDQSSGGFFPGS